MNNLYTLCAQVPSCTNCSSCIVFYWIKQFDPSKTFFQSCISLNSYIFRVNITNSARNSMMFVKLWNVDFRLDCNQSLWSRTGYVSQQHFAENNFLIGYICYNISWSIQGCTSSSLFACCGGMMCNRRVQPLERNCSEWLMPVPPPSLLYTRTVPSLIPILQFVLFTVLRVFRDLKIVEHSALSPLLIFLEYGRLYP